MAILIEHHGLRPRVDPSARVAAGATLSGEVTIGPGSAVLHGAVLIAAGGPVVVGADCVVMEHAVLRGTPGHPTRLGDAVLVGPGAHLSGCTVGDGAFLATRATVFNGARVGVGAEVRIGGVVHVNTVLPDAAVVPIAWVAVGDPAQILPPDQHERIWEVQRTADFPGTVWGVERSDGGAVATRRYARSLVRHADERILPPADENG